MTTTPDEERIITSLAKHSWFMSFGKPVRYTPLDITYSFENVKPGYYENDHEAGVLEAHTGGDNPVFSAIGCAEVRGGSIEETLERCASLRRHILSAHLIALLCLMTFLTIFPFSFDAAAEKQPTPLYEPDSIYEFNYRERAPVF
ncbi:hypothetical protein [Methylocucumis oryzae]|uniref:Uncharacterized protein n=1 Tax=Methylocucumis oryzae TaxID=1632867 RepID=A0A0F3IEB6_9GAMM|nr:hypothetical protein [Methylocucumis oryzae]KJV05027.1 hypothetical protein VZ94_21110 [Methylocucumis oryzae]